MKIVTILVALLLSTTLITVWADNKGNPMGQHNMPGMNQGSSMMDMQSLHNHFRDMEKTMVEINKTKNDKQHWDLMQKHMQEMQASMTMMGPMMNMMGNAQGQMSSEQMMNQFNMMDQRMDMMQQVMQHMMDQQSAMLHNGNMMNRNNMTK